MIGICGIIRIYTRAALYKSVAVATSGSQIGAVSV